MKALTETEKNKMRCKKCNVDLAETYTRCPLCGENASNEKPQLEGLTVAPYPKNAPVKPLPDVKKPKYGFSTERLKAFFNL